MDKKRGKALSDGEVNDAAFKKLIGDLGGIEAEGLFKEDQPSAPSGGSLKIEITHSMDGQQTKSKPVIEDEPEEDRKPSKLGK
jgi:hypothetical protein